MDHSRKLIALSLRWYDVRIHQGILEYAKTKKWDIVAMPHMGLALDIPEADGQIVMLGPNDLRRSRLVEKYDVPAIDLSHYSSLDIPRVYPDNTKAGRLAAEEFLKRGFKEFAVFSTQSHWYVDERRGGFCHAIGEKGYSAANWHMPQTDHQKGSFSPNPEDRAMLEKWLTDSPRPIAVYAIEDEGAALLMRACHRLGLAVPEQVALIGTNNDPVICPYTEVPLSSIDLNWEGVGYAAAARLDRLLQGEHLEEPLTHVEPKGLVARQSSDILAVEDLRVATALSYIKNNSHRHLSVAEITKEIDVPLRTLQWVFKRAMNCSIQDEISRCRLERVKNMLLNTDRNAGQIAEELGFSSAQYMNHFFSKAMGQTPNEFRKQAHPNRYEDEL